ncbi:MAG TPA: xanthine dehydrogenase family protein molybdopterin-binding subunit, partial [Gemmatimonadaceae bacterium]|nr:xanthine dehydrogenase family protein molybdopterin-binding subunit [Gemmatimonadaceae bacterium]
EELDADWSKVRVARAPTNGKYNTSTGGSQSTRSSYMPLRQAGATARAMLVGAAAAQWGVPASQCTTAAGVVTHAASKRSATYGELAAKAAAQPVPAGDVPLKDPSTFTLIGRATPRLDIPAKVNGTAQFGIDTRVPNMLYASVARCPVFGGSLASVDDAKARAVAGVYQVVKLDAVERLLPARVAVLAEDTWAAMKARDALDITWNPGPNANYSTEAANAGYHQRVNDDANAGVTASKGAVRAAGAGERTVEAIYEFPLLAHATMEPMNCTADVRADGVEIWAPSQAPDSIRTGVAKFLGVAPDTVTVHVTFLGGGFGRRSQTDYAIEAVQLSKAAGRPVKVTWTREEDIQHDFYRVDGIQRLRAVLDAQGRVVSWEDRVVGPSTEAYAFPGRFGNRHFDAAARPPYDIANYRLDMVLVDSPVPMWFWRAVSNTQNGYCMEAFLDECAHAAGQDPVQYRLAMLAGNPRAVHVVQLAAQKAGWGTPLAKGQGRGFAFYDYDGTLVAQVVEAEVPPDGKVKVHRVVCAFDCGQMINPDTVVAQVESAVGWALSAARYGEITVKNGAVQQSNFTDYQVVRMNEMPRVEVHLVDNHEPPTGVGEPGVPPFAPALLNAIFDATGARLRRLPVKPEMLKAGAATD